MYGIQCEAAQWFKSYLNDWKQRVEIESSNSNNTSNWAL
jgi:hypothetical protein